MAKTKTKYVPRIEGNMVFHPATIFEPSLWFHRESGRFLAYTADAEHEAPDDRPPDRRARRGR